MVACRFKLLLHVFLMSHCMESTQGLLELKIFFFFLHFVGLASSGMYKSVNLQQLCYI